LIIGNICSKCGLPKEICICGAMAKDITKIKIFLERRRFGKFVTVIDGIDESAKPKEIAKKLKTKLGTGGTYKNRKIELQGNHKLRVKKMLIEFGFDEKQIED